MEALGKEEVDMRSKAKLKMESEYQEKVNHLKEQIAGARHLS